VLAKGLLQLGASAIGGGKKERKKKIKRANRLHRQFGLTRSDRDVAAATFEIGRDTKSLDPRRRIYTGRAGHPARVARQPDQTSNVFGEESVAKDCRQSHWPGTSNTSGRIPVLCRRKPHTARACGENLLQEAFGRVRCD